MKILITGGAGFIGSNLAKKCVDFGYKVDIVDDFSNGHREFLPPGINDLYVSDFSSDLILQKIQNKNYDVVFHLAATPRVSYSVEYPLKTNDNNVTKSLLLIENCKNNVQRFIFASSSSVYGNSVNLPTHESNKKDPQSPYALQKSIIEDYLKLYNSLYGLESACMRFFNVFGENALGSSPYATALAAWLTAIKNNDSMRFDGNGTQSRDLCHVENVTDALIKAALTKKVLQSNCYNVACGDKTSNLELLNYLLQRYPQSKWHTAPWRPGDVMHTLADVSSIKEDLGYEPSVRVWEGVERTCDWYDQNWYWIKDLKQGV